MNATTTGDGRPRYIFDMKMTKRVGLYQILDPSTAKVYGCNVYHAVLAAFVLYLSGVSVVCGLCLYYTTNNMIMFTLYIGCFTNFLFGCYKMTLVMARSERIWRCMDVTGFAFMSYRRYDRNVFQRWRRRTARTLAVYAVIIFVTWLIWSSTPVVFSAASVTMKNADYRMNIFNVYQPAVSADTYDGHFDAFYYAEAVVLVSYLYFSVAFDTIMIVGCFALSCQLEAITDAVKSLGYRRPTDGCSCDTGRSCSCCVNNETECNVVDDLKKIISDHQKVIKKLDDFYSIFRNTTYTQLLMASSSQVMIWFIFSLGFSQDKTGDSVLSILKVFFVLPVFVFQLFMTCYLFGIINEKKESIIFGLYSSSWYTMDIQSKILILFFMKTNNANQLKLKITNNLIVNLELFSRTMRICYSIFSMLTKYNNNK